MITGRRDRLLIGMLAGLGLRVGEAAGLDLSDLRFNTGHRTVVIRGKGGRTRELPVPATLLRHLEPHLAHRRRTLTQQRLDAHYARRSTPSANSRSTTCAPVSGNPRTAGAGPTRSSFSRP